MKRRRGFVLLMILVLLAVAAAGLAETCRRSMADTLAASQEQVELQQRWGTLSLEAALLPRAELLIQQAEIARHRPMSAIDLSINLGDQTFAITLADEQAKLNINTLFQVRGRAAAERSARAAVREADMQLSSSFRPSAGAAPLESLGQILVSARGVDALTAASQITCWGDGRLNWRRASAVALNEQCDQPLGIAVVNRLAALQTIEPALAVADLLADPKIAAGGVAQQLGELLTDVSRCHSIWVVCRAGSGAARYDQMIVDQTGDGPARTFRFSW